MNKYIIQFLNVLIIEEPAVTVEKKKKSHWEKRILWTKTQFPEMFLHDNETPPAPDGMILSKAPNHSLDTREPKGTAGDI